ncbi:MAG: hypothetical protein K5Q68_09125 [Roseococcus sp.]|nr:hypothetical protein [Roseococcus sp.]
MRILFTIGLGIFPEQRVDRWRMVARLFLNMSQAFEALGHQVFFMSHPEALIPELPAHLVWVGADHEHLDLLTESFKPDFVFTWNGSSPGDRVTATLASAAGAKMVFAEQGWMPQKDTIYFDMKGTNANCSTRNSRFAAVTSLADQARFNEIRRNFIDMSKFRNPINVTRLEIRPFDMSKAIFVPLQDERDLNILLDSPFKSMQALLQFLTEKLPSAKFLVRPHPKYPNPQLDTFDNVEVADPKKSMFDQLADCGGVIGINSTTLIESALLGYSVVSLGGSLATGTGLFLDWAPGEELSSEVLAARRVDQEAAAATLHHLLCVKQMLREDLGDPGKIRTSALFSEMVRMMKWNPISR